MKGMLIKDIRLLLQQRRFIVLVIVGTIVWACTQENGFAIGWLMSMCAIWAGGTISYDEFDNGFPFLMTLPAERKTYVLGKYVFGVLLMAGSLLAYEAVLAGALLAKGAPDLSAKLPEELLGDVGGFSVCLLFLAIMIPIQIKFGVERGRVILLFVFAATALVGQLALRSGLAEELAQGIRQALTGVPGGVLVVIALAAALSLLLLSALISISIMNRKEF